MKYTSYKTTFQTYSNGTPGDPGAPGTTPHIGSAANNEEAGYWYIGTTNTRIKAEGADALTMLLSNDSDIIVRNNLGAIVGDLPTTEAFVLQGATEVAKATITPTPPTDFIENGGKYTFTDNKLTIDELPEGFTAGAFTFTHSGISKTFSLKVVSSEVDYNLVIDKTLINSTEKGGTVKITVKKISADGTKILEAPYDEEKSKEENKNSEKGVQLRIGRSTNYASSWQIGYDKGDTDAIPVKLEVQVGDEWIVWDEETIEFVANGTPGGNGASLQVIYKTGTTAPTTPNGENPDGWDADMPSTAGNEKVYMSQKMSNTTTWSTPIQISAIDGLPGKDGGDIEYVYYLCNNDETDPAPTTPPSYNGTTLASGWTPSPSGITPQKQYEYVSVRTKPTGGNWDSFSIPVIWSKWGDKGQDGDGVTYYYCLTNSNVKPEYPKSEYNWTPDPQGVTKSNQYEYVVAIKTGEVVNSSNTKTGTLWAKWSEDGAPSVAYWLVASSSVIAKEADGTYKTESITFTPMMQIGNGNPGVCENAYLASWVDNADAPASGDPSKQLVVELGATTGKTDVKNALHCRMFIKDSNGNQVKVDEQTAEVVADGSGVQISSVEYAISNDGINPDQDGWSTDQVEPTAGKFVLTKITYSNGSEQITASYIQKDGTNGDTSETVFIYKKEIAELEDGKRSLTTPSTPIGNSFPEGWSDTALVSASQNEFVFRSTGIKKTSGANGDVTYGSWTTPELYSAYISGNVSGEKAAAFYKLFGYGDAEQQGIKYDDEGDAYINASMINAGTLTVTKGGEGDDKNDVLFSAGWNDDGTGNVKIGALEVSQLASKSDVAAENLLFESEKIENWYFSKEGGMKTATDGGWVEASLKASGPNASGHDEQYIWLYGSGNSSPNADAINLEARNYVLSWEAKGKCPDGGHQMFILNEGWTAKSVLSTTFNTTKDVWQRVSYKFTVPEGGWTKIIFRFDCNTDKTSEEYDLSIRKVQLQVGSDATAWKKSQKLVGMADNVNTNDFSWKFSSTEGMFMWNGPQHESTEKDAAGKEYGPTRGAVLAVYNDPIENEDGTITNYHKLSMKGKVEADEGSIGAWTIGSSSIFAGINTLKPGDITSADGSSFTQEELDELGSVGMYCGSKWVGKSLLSNGTSPVRFYAGLKKNNDTGEITANFLVLEDGSTYMTAGKIGDKSVISNKNGEYINFTTLIDKHNSLNDQAAYLYNVTYGGDVKYEQAKIDFNKNIEAITIDAEERE